MFAEDDDQIDGLADEPINAIDLFGEEEADPQLLPPLSPSAENVDQQGDGEEASTATKKVRKQINRAPTLNPLWLCQPHGITAVNDFFNNLPIKGKGHEAEDLQNILQRYEYWAQQCYPKLCFKDVVEKVESFSHKGPIKSKLQVIRNQRTDQLHREAKSNENEEEEEDNAAQGSDDVSNTPANDPRPSQLNTSTTSQSSTITEDMKEMIRRKREEAIAKRKRKLEESFNASTASDALDLSRTDPLESPGRTPSSTKSTKRSEDTNKAVTINYTPTLIDNAMKELNENSKMDSNVAEEEDGMTLNDLNTDSNKTSSDEIKTKNENATESVVEDVEGKNIDSLENLTACNSPTTTQPIDRNHKPERMDVSDSEPFVSSSKESVETVNGPPNQRLSSSADVRSEGSLSETVDRPSVSTDESQEDISAFCPYLETNDWES